MDQQGQRVSATHDKAAASVERIGHKAAGVATAIAGMGEVGVSAAEKIAHAATNIAFSFGEAGPIVAAVGIAGVAIFNLFTQARKEMEATDKKARDLLRSLTLETGIQAQTTIYSGDPFAKAGSPEQMGLAAARARVAELNATLQRAERGPTQGRGTQAATADDRRERDDLVAWLKQAEPLYDRVSAQVTKLTSAYVDQQTAVLKMDAEKKAAEDALAQPAKDEAALSKRIEILTRGLVFDDLRSRITRELTNLENQLTAATNDGSRSLEARAQAGAHLLAVQTALAQRFSTPTPATSAAGLVGAVGTGQTSAADFQQAYGGPMGNVKPGATNLIDQSNDLMQQRAQEFLRTSATIASTIRNGLAQTLGDAVYEGFSAAFSGKGLGGVFKALGKTVLSGIGGIFKQLGMVWLEYGAAMFKWSALLWNPATSGIAALAIGVLLTALGGALGAVGNSAGGGGGAGGGTGGYYGSSGAAESVTTIRLMPGYGNSGSEVTARNPVTVNATIIGRHDPQAQRDIMDLVNSAERRGL